MDNQLEPDWPLVRGWGRILCVIAALASGNTAFAQRNREEPQAIKLRSGDLMLTGEFRGEESTRQDLDTGETQGYERELITPVIAGGIVGSIFHPNLITFDFRGQYGLSEEESVTDIQGLQGGGGSGRVLNYNTSVTILGAKPYPLRLFSYRSEGRRDYDQFRRLTIETDGNGLSFAFVNSVLPFQLTWESEESRTVNELELEVRREERLDFRSRKTWSQDAWTELRYEFEDFDQEFLGTDPYSGSLASINLADSRLLNRERGTRLVSSLNIRELERDDEKNTASLLRETLSSRLGDNFRFNGSYVYSSQNRGEIEASSHGLDSSLTHQLYSSLTSTFSLRGSAYEVGGGGADDSGLGYGVGILEAYTKRLSDWGKLVLSYDFFTQIDERDSLTALTSSIDERVTLNDGDVTLLNRPDIDSSTVEVTDGSGSVLYVQGSDYTLLERGEFLEIRRVFGGRIPNGSTVRVSYAAVTDTSVETKSNRNRGRADLYLLDSRLRLYAETARTTYDGDVSAAFQNQRNSLFGFSYAHGFLEVGASSRSYESDSIVYESFASYQRINYSPAPNQVFLFEADQTRTRYEDEVLDQQVETYILRYNNTLSERALLRTMVGFRSEQLEGTQRDSTTGEVGLDYRIGRLKFNFAYWYQEEETLAAFREDHRTYIRVERDFW